MQPEKLSIASTILSYTISHHLFPDLYWLLFPKHKVFAAFGDFKILFLLGTFIC